jgi:hypothetical protein
LTEGAAMRRPNRWRATEPLGDNQRVDDFDSRDRLTQIQIFSIEMGSVGFGIGMPIPVTMAYNAYQ